MDDTKVKVRSGHVRSLNTNTSADVTLNSSWSSSRVVVKINGVNGKRRIDAINQRLRGTSKTSASTSK